MGFRILEFPFTAELRKEVGGADPPRFPAVVLKFVDEQTTPPTAERCYRNEDQELPVPPAIKNIRRYDHESILPFEVSSEDKPIKAETICKNAANINELKLIACASVNGGTKPKYWD
jgi:hypothetical protein